MFNFIRENYNAIMAYNDALLFGEQLLLFFISLMVGFSIIFYLTFRQPEEIIYKLGFKSVDGMVVALAVNFIIFHGAISSFCPVIGALIVAFVTGWVIAYPILKPVFKYCKRLFSIFVFYFLK